MINIQNLSIVFIVILVIAVFYQNNLLTNKINKIEKLNNTNEFKNIEKMKV